MPPEENGSNNNGSSNGNGTNSWIMYQRLVLAEMERHNEDICTLKKDQNTQRTDFEVLKAKILAYGLIGGTAAGLITSAIIQLILHFIIKATGTS
jgi:hypothetical protein